MRWSDKKITPHKNEWWTVSSLADKMQEILEKSLIEHSKMLDKDNYQYSNVYMQNRKILLKSIRNDVLTILKKYLIEEE